MSVPPPCGGPGCLVAMMAHAVQALTNDVASLHQSVLRMRPDTWLERTRNVALTVAGILVSAASFVWLYDRVVRP